MIAHDNAPIVAIATALGRGGIGVIRVSGNNLQPLVFSALRCELKHRYAHYMPFLNESHEIIDKGIAIYFKSPHSYTGEDVLELQAHGGTAVLQRLLDYLLVIGKPYGLRLANPGEFSFRAYVNDKIDLVQAEAIDDLINANSQAAAEAAAASLNGSFSHEVNGITAELVILRTLVEATLDFPEEEIEFVEKYQIRTRLDELLLRMKLLLKDTEQSYFLSTGLKIALVGEPNVGKSSLMNAIFNKNVSIVTDIPGTTRDSIKENLNLDGVPISIVDTAGLRQTNEYIEKIGIERSLETIKDSDVIFDIVDARYPNSVLEAFAPLLDTTLKAVVTIHNKIDLLDTQNDHKVQGNPNHIFVSALNRIGLETLKKSLLKHTGRRLGEKSPWLARKRHVVAIKSSLEHLQHAHQYAEHQDAVLDLLAEELRLCHLQLGAITGQMTADELLGKIFSTFCIGK